MATTLQMLSQSIENQARFQATAIWTVKSADLGRWLEQKGLSVDELTILVEGLRQKQPTTVPPDRLVEEVKKQIISNMLKGGGSCR